MYDQYYKVLQGQALVATTKIIKNKFYHASFTFVHYTNKHQHTIVENSCTRGKPTFVNRTFSWIFASKYRVSHEKL
ncbi:unnamed protein product [Acanthoscelides obtectus]|uniref:Uncharacterized protein n=1 Tax=Acanthoscelides obtectus TaxID=200917 RepID=A0A9P0K535_ACAOB|nr:unnamed protein product [Acanthoscelides obtectus]CAK1626789.1 hypothetical protein AOBTE_LOCUS4078 [Acanthoscelides obtectus]